MLDTYAVLANSQTITLSRCLPADAIVHAEVEDVFANGLDKFGLLRLHLDFPNKPKL